MDYLRKTGIKDHEAIPGSRGDYIWKRIDNGVAEFWVISLWDSFEAIREFAGPQEDKAILLPRGQRVSSRARSPCDALRDSTCAGTIGRRAC
jgi:hypothetical protein